MYYRCRNFKSVFKFPWRVALETFLCFWGLHAVSFVFVYWAEEKIFMTMVLIKRCVRLKISLFIMSVCLSMVQLFFLIFIYICKMRCILWSFVSCEINSTFLILRHFLTWDTNESGNKYIILIKFFAIKIRLVNCHIAS